MLTAFEPENSVRECTVHQQVDKKPVDSTYRYAMLGLSRTCNMLMQSCVYMMS